MMVMMLKYQVAATSTTTQENYPTGKTAPSATGPGGLAPWALWFYGVFPYRLTGGAMASERRAHVR